jgi:hypothetical protein
VFDTSGFLALNPYYPSVFPSLWKRIDQMVEESRLISVRDVNIECQNEDLGVHVSEWVNRNKSIFSIPQNDELTYVTKILDLSEFQDIRIDYLNHGLPVPGAFLAASARKNNGCVVTQNLNGNDTISAAMICDTLSIKRVSLQELDLPRKTGSGAIYVVCG